MQILAGSSAVNEEKEEKHEDIKDIEEQDFEADIPVFFRIEKSISSAKKFLNAEFKKQSLDPEIRKALEKLQKYVNLLDTTSTDYSNWVDVAEGILIEEDDEDRDNVEDEDVVTLASLETMVADKQGILLSELLLMIILLNKLILIRGRVFSVS